MKKQFLFCLAILLLTFLFSSCQTTEPIAQKQESELGRALQKIFQQSEVFSGMFTGFILYDPASDEVIYAQNEKKYFTPASNTKLYTFYTGLKILPENIPALEYIIRGDSLIFWGTGDPSFLRSDLDDGTVYEFLENNSKNLFYSDAHFQSHVQGVGWMWDDYLSGYSAERSPFPMYGNLVTFEMQEITTTRIVADSNRLQISPPFFRDLITKAAHSYKADKRPVLFRGFTNNKFLYYPETDTVTYTETIPYHYTPQLITKLLSDTLHKPVEYIHMEIPENTKKLYSAIADSVYKHMLQPSDNFIAEQLLLVASSVLWKELNSENVIEYMKEHYLKYMPDEPIWVDGSGLSHYNLFTPRSMVWLLQQIDNEFETDEALFELLPAGGVSGTLENWYAPRDGGAPYIYAKTGTLSNVHCVSGFLITESGHKLVFSFMNNHYNISTSRLKEEMEKVFWFVHEHYRISF